MTLSSDDGPEPNYYKILGVSPKEADPSTLKKAYHRLTKKYHPDKNTSSADHESFKDISRAYRVLSDPVLKRDYDSRRNPSSNIGGLTLGTGLGLRGQATKDLVTSTMEDFAKAFSTIETGFGSSLNGNSGGNGGCSLKPAFKSDNLCVHYGQSLRQFKKCWTDAGRRLRQVGWCAHCNKQLGQLDQDNETVACLGCTNKAKNRGSSSYF